jgi:acetyl esterase/lipase
MDSRQRLQVGIEKDVEFGRGGDRPLRCDIYRPDPPARGPFPALLLLHGGGWQRGDRAAMRGFALRTAREGFVCVAPEYRLTPEAPFPAQIHDVKTALRWLRARSRELGIDPERIAVQGSSAGAHLALLAAGTPELADFEGEGGHAGESTRVAAVVGIYPPTLFHLDAPRPSGALPARALLGRDATYERALQASPITHVSPAFPPTFLIHGSADRVVPPSATLRMYEALTSARVPVDLHVIAGQPHGFAQVPEHQRDLVREIVGFLRRAGLCVPEGDPVIVPAALSVSS